MIHELESRRGARVVSVASGQHDDLLRPFVAIFGLRTDHDLRVMRPGQSPSGVLARVLESLDPILEQEKPDVVLVQGDTTTTLAGAVAAFHRKIPVGHVEAGLRSGDLLSPFPEEMNRTLVSRLATWHFAATDGNRQTLLREGVHPGHIFVTGNPVVDALELIRSRAKAGPQLSAALAATEGLRTIVLTTHRRESFGEVMTENLRALRGFLERHEDVALLFPVHPNPVVVAATRSVLDGQPRLHLLPPLVYDEFILLLSKAWLIVSDSGGVQEEAPSLGRPLLILRENTERPESVECGIARLVGGRPEALGEMLEEAAQPGSWVERVSSVQNPFGHGDAARRIADVLMGVGARLSA